MILEEPPARSAVRMQKQFEEIELIKYLKHPRN